MAGTIPPACEACGEADEAMKAALLAQGRFALQDAGIFRAPILCPACRQALVALVSATRAGAATEPSPPGDDPEVLPLRGAARGN